MCNNCENKSDSGNSFVMGIFLGAIIGAVAAVYIYKNNQSEVFLNLKKKLEDYFKDFIGEPSSPSPAKVVPKSKKITVDIPKNVEVVDLTPSKVSSRRKMFVKGK